MIDNTITNKPLFDIATIEVVDGQVNLAKMASNFPNKNVKDWKRLKSTTDFLASFAVVYNSPNGILSTKQGGTGEQGTFAPREVALEFARWISPKFAVWANKQIDTLLQTGKVELPAKQIDLPQNYIQALKALVIAEEDKLLLQGQLEAQKDDVEFAQTLKASVNALPFDQAVKAMKLPYGRTTLFAKCRELGVLNPKNHPYQEYVDRGYFQVLEYSYTKPNGDVVCTTKTMITPKGQQWLLGKLNGEKVEITYNLPYKD